MRVLWRWTRWALSLVFFFVALFGVWQYAVVIYVLQQARGQVEVLFHTQSLEEYSTLPTLSPRERSNIRLIGEIKRFSVDSLGFDATSNYTRVFRQHQRNTLWVITACDPYSFTAYTWRFPLVGEVSYKGFFNKVLAEKEVNHLKAAGYDVDMRGVSAWSTLGWFSDPVLSSMLLRSRAGFCNLLFHELFHSTYYAPGSVDLNENLANFIADKATLQFLRNDTAAINQWRSRRADEEVYTRYLARKKQELEICYAHSTSSDRQQKKMLALWQIADSLLKLPVSDSAGYQRRAAALLRSGNAWFVDLQQYESLQDSLEIVFNKFYGGSVKLFIEQLKQNRINY